MRFLLLIIAALLAAGCAVYPSARDHARVLAGDSAGRFAATAMPQGLAYERLCGSIAEVEGTVTAVVTSGPRRLVLDGVVLVAFAEINEDEAATKRVGERVLVKGIVRWDPERQGWLSPAVFLPLPAPQ
jgi:hypothetical protein